MKTQQSVWTPGAGWQPALTPFEAHLVLVFGSREHLADGRFTAELAAAYPDARVLGCSTAGEIVRNEVRDNTVTATAVRFDDTRLKTAKVRIAGVGESREAGGRLAAMLPSEGLRHVFVLSDGLKVNGSALVQGLSEALPAGVGLTGGLSGDGGRFQETLVLCDGPAEAGAVAVAGLYGDKLKIGYGSLGGWDTFGPERLITRSEGNVLYELDGQSALGLYKRYLGEHAQGLPATGLLFPLCLRTPDNGKGVVRTILSVDEAAQSMTFAGDMLQGGHAQLMKANFDRLIDGAMGAARNSCQALEADRSELAVLISCVGRKMVLKQRVEEEVDGVRQVLGRRPAFTGFYSYGEISPFTPDARCELHNQTMTVTTFSES